MKIGIDLGGSHIGVGLIEDGKLITSEDSFYTVEEKENIEKAVETKIDCLIKNVLENNHLSLENIEYIGISSPGTISDGKITAWNLGLKEFPLRDIIKQNYSKKVIIRNDGKCAALAEKNYGSLKDYDDAIFINIGTGIGGAAFIAGKLLEPKRFSGFEFGHITVEKDGIECTCGKKGCFERYASIKALKLKVAKKLNVDTTDLSGQYLRENLMVEHHDEIIDEVNEYIKYLSIGLGDLIDIFEPEVICFGGSFSYYEETKMYKLLMQEMQKSSTTFNKKLPKFIMADNKNDAGMIGAVIE